MAELIFRTPQASGDIDLSKRSGAVDPVQVEEWNKTEDRRMRAAERMYAHLLREGELPVQVREGAPGGKPGKRFTIKMRTGMGAKGFGVIEPGRKRPSEGYKMLGKNRMLDWLSNLEPQRGTRIQAMDELRKQVIKLAYENPGEVREALLPLLREAGAEGGEATSAQGEGDEPVREAAAEKQADSQARRRVDQIYAKLRSEPDDPVLWVGLAANAASVAEGLGLKGPHGPGRPAAMLKQLVKTLLSQKGTHPGL